MENFRQVQLAVFYTSTHKSQRWRIFRRTLCRELFINGEKYFTFFFFLQCNHMRGKYFRLKNKTWKLLTRRQSLKKSDEKFNAVPLEIGKKSFPRYLIYSNAMRGVVIDTNWFSATKALIFIWFVSIFNWICQYLAGWVANFHSA